MSSTITRTVRIEYVEITRVAPAATPAPAPTVKATVAEPTRLTPPAAQPRKGDIVEYYSQAGRRGEYRVNTVGQDGTRVELKGYNRRSGFWVDAGLCRYLRRAW